MSQSPKRARRIADLLRQELALLIQKEISDPRLSDVSIQSVEMTSDLGTARVFYTMLRDTHKDEVQATLEKATGYFRHLLASAVDLRYVPKLVFIYDVVLLQAEKLTTLINQVAPLDDVIADESPL